MIEKDMTYFLTFNFIRKKYKPETIKISRLLSLDSPSSSAESSNLFLTGDEFELESVEKLLHRLGFNNKIMFLDGRDLYKNQL